MMSAGQMKNFRIRLLCALVAAVILICTVPSYADDEKKTVSGPIDITFDASKAFATSRLTGGQISEALLRSGISALGSQNAAPGGWYVDSGIPYTCLVINDGTDEPGGWEKLSYDNENLNPEKEYYFRFEIEETGGFRWDTANHYPVTVNGKPADYVTYPTEETGAIDAYVKAEWNETADIVISVKTEFDNYVVQRGTSKKIGYTVVGTNDSVIWSVGGGESANTSISQDGTLSVGSDETASVLYLRCASATDGSVFYDAASVWLTDDHVGIDYVKVLPPKEGVVAYPATCVNFDSEAEGTDTKYVRWKITSETTDAGTVIDEYGSLWVGEAETATEITVRATSVNDTSKYGEYTVPVGAVSRIEGPIYIDYGIEAAAFISGMTGREASEFIVSPGFGLSGYFRDTCDATGRGWYVDGSVNYTCLVVKSEDNEPQYWEKLYYSEEKPDPEKEYYIRIEIEDFRNNGFEWDTGSVPDVFVNGVKPDIVVPPADPTGALDVFVRIYTEDQTPEPVKLLYVTFNGGGGEPEHAVQTVREGDFAEKPSDPVKRSLEFAGWWLDDEEYDFSSPVTEDITLTARYVSMAEAHALGKSGTVYVSSDTENASRDVKSGWYSYEGGFGSFGAKPADGYVLSEWRAGAPDGEPVRSENPSDPVHLNENGDVCFSLEDGGYVFYAVFRPEGEETDGESETSFRQTETEEDTGPANTTDAPGDGSPDIGAALNGLKSAVTVTVIISGALVASGIAAAVIYAIKRRKSGKGKGRRDRDE